MLFFSFFLYSAPQLLGVEGDVTFQPLKLSLPKMCEPPSPVVGNLYHDKKSLEPEDGALSHLFPSVVKPFPQGLQFCKPSSILLIKEPHDLDHNKFFIYFRYN